MPSRDQWVQVEDGRIVRQGLPRNGTMRDGTQVSGYDQLGEEELRKEGWRRITDEGPPSYDPRFYEKAHRELVVGDGEVFADYELIPREPSLEANGNVVSYRDIESEGQEVTFFVEGEEIAAVDVLVEDGTAELELNSEGISGSYTVTVNGDHAVEVSL